MECHICHKLFKSERGYTHHTNFKICLKSGKYFKDKRNYDYHIENSVCSKQLHINETKPKLRLKSHYDTLTRDELIEKLVHIEGKYEALKENPQTVNNSQINIVVPPAFLALDSCQQLTKLLPNLLHNALSHHPSNFISYLIKETTCNPHTPLFNSVKLTNKKRPVCTDI